MLTAIECVLNAKYISIGNIPEISAISKILADEFISVSTAPFCYEVYESAKYTFVHRALANTI